MSLNRSGCARELLNASKSVEQVARTFAGSAAKEQAGMLWDVAAMLRDLAIQFVPEIKVMDEGWRVPDRMPLYIRGLGPQTGRPDEEDNE